MIEEVTGVSWEEHLRTRIFARLNMTRTGITVDNMVQKDDHSAGYSCIKLFCIDEPEPKLMDYYLLDSAIAPAGSIHSSVNDMNNWLLYLLSRGTIVDLVSPKGFEKLLMPQMTIPSLVRPNWLYSQSSYALGWVVTAYKGRPMLWHTGGINVSAIAIKRYVVLSIVLN